MNGGYPTDARRNPPTPSAPTVIPAQAGIQNPGLPRRGEMAGGWIPAFAGMTIEGAGMTIEGAGMTIEGAGMTDMGRE